MHTIEIDKEFKDILEAFADGVPAIIDCGYGWGEIVKECHNFLLNEDPNYTISQIKEKFGGLRYYFNPTDMKQYARLSGEILKIEDKSFSVCETCGDDGSKRTSSTGRIYVSCDLHEII